MTVHSVNVRLKGQMTLPIEVREDLGIQEGGKLLLERRGTEWVLARPENLKDTAAGSLAKYAKTQNPDPSEERRQAAQYIARMADRDG